MKVTPSNQTLILASERGGPTPRPAAALDHALSIASGDTVLQRLTIVASHPDATLLYVQADYAAPAESASNPARSFGNAPSTGALIAPAANTGAVARAAPSAPRSLSQSTGNRGVGLYASTQRILADSPATPHIDVHA
ncbi:MAG: hypothetical protein ABSH33_08940 [Steroidobacteraceae bacterium]